MLFKILVASTWMSGDLRWEGHNTTLSQLSGQRRPFGWYAGWGPTFGWINSTYQVSRSATTLPDSHGILLCYPIIRLSQILGHALRKLQSPGELSDLERSLAVQSLNQELDRWLAETPRFFHPDGPDTYDLGPFASVPPFFQRYAPFAFYTEIYKSPNWPVLAIITGL